MAKPVVTGSAPVPASRGWVTLSRAGFHLDASWEIQPGQVLVLFGPSGAGKSTTLRAIAGLERPQRGHIEIGGQVVFDHAESVWAPPHLRHVGYLTQQTHLFPHLNLVQNIAYSLPRRQRRESEPRVRKIISDLRLDGLESRRTWELSGGEQQRVGLARALVTEPRLLLLDEPFASLDSELRRALRRELRLMLAATPVPVILVTHDREEALALGDAVQVLDAGKVTATGLPLDVLGQPGQGEVARLVGVENLLKLKVSARNPRDGTMVCEGGGLRLEAPLRDSRPVHGQSQEEREQVTVGLRSSDIILVSREPEPSSARNRFRGTVVGVELRPPGYEVTLDCGTELRCHITGRALAEMAIVPGQVLWAVFKASSCFLVSEEAAGIATPGEPDTGAKG